MTWRVITIIHRKKMVQGIDKNIVLGIISYLQGGIKVCVHFILPRPHFVGLHWVGFAIV